MSARFQHVALAAGICGASVGCASTGGIVNPQGTEAVITAAVGAALDQIPERRAGDATGPPPPLVVSPSRLEFKAIDRLGEATLPLTLSNPAYFPLTVLRATTIGGCFKSDADAPFTIAARAQRRVLVTARPEGAATCSGALLIEVDSAGGRFLKIGLAGAARK